MKTIDLLKQLKDEVSLICVIYYIDIDLDDDDAVADFVYIDLEYIKIEPEHKHLMITYNYLLQLKAGNPKQVDILVEINE